MPKRKTAKSSKPAKTSGEQVGDSRSLNKVKLAKKKQKQITVLSEQEQKCLLEQITDLIFKDIPKSQVSLLNDYVESEFILIDGDSLFITCASDSTLQRGQNLHFFFLVECFLLDLTSKGAKYIIVFFKDAEQIYHENPDLLSLRTALIVHLVNNTDIAVQTEFSNCLDDSWNDFLKKISLSFLIISDEGLNQLQTNLLHIFIIHALSRRISIVFISGQESDMVRIYGYRIHGGKDHQEFFRKHQTNIKLCLENLLKNLERSGTEVLLSLLGCLCLEAVKGKGKRDIRYIVCIVSCSLVLEVHNKELQSTTQKQKPPLTLQDVADLIRMYCLSVALLHHLPLSQRIQIRLITNNWNKETSVLIQQHRFCEFLVLKHLTSEMLWNTDMFALPDLHDDLLWKNIVHYYEVEGGQEFGLDIRSNICRDYEYLWSNISALSKTVDVGTPFPLRRTSKCFLTKKSSLSEANASKMTVPRIKLIPMMCTVVDEFAGDILKDLAFLKSDDPSDTSAENWGKNNKHLCWNSRRPLTDHYAGTAEDLWALQNLSVLQTSRCCYGQSLVDNSSKMNDIELDNSKSICTDVEKSKKNYTQAQMIIEENQKQKRAEEIQKREKIQWDDSCMSTEREIKDNFKSGIDNLETIVKTFQNKSVKLAIKMAGLNVCFDKWKEHCEDKGEPQKNLNLVVGIMRRIHSLLTNYQDVLKEDDYQQIVKYLRYLGFSNLIATSKHTKVQGEKGQAFTKKLSPYATGIGSARFQLEYMGQYLIREERDDPDPRVQHFIPDTWQREILDIVDNNESAVIVAPPSSGKSEASYYCVEKILRDSNEGTVVYVVPTQALVNQVVATVYGRFNKTLPEGLTLCGIFTQGHWHAALKCQVLVTMPQYFEDLLLAPHHQKWVKRIRYVIFDEICYNGIDVGTEVWESLLLMIQCPFLVLSAAITNPEHLVEWLQSVKRYWRKCAKIAVSENSGSSAAAEEKTNKKSARKQNKLYRLKLVLHEGRYNDFERYVCSVKDDDFTIHHYHPYAALTVEHIKKYGFPVDLVLSPRETIVLYDTMVKVRTNWPKADKLDPEKYIHFKNKTVITKADARLYEKKLKKEFKMWIECDYNQEAGKVLKLLKPPVQCCSEKQMSDRFPHFVEKLQQMDKLPAVFFMLNIKRAGDLAKKVYHFLEEKQRDMQIEKQEPLLTTKLGNIEKSANTKQTDDMKLPCENDRTLVGKMQPENIMQQLEKIVEVPAGCTYANYKAVDIKDLHKIFDYARFIAKHEDLKKLALRGIGYHHAFLEQKGKQFVEILFKMGFIQVVTATGTLALGINTPCKSVVFVQNSEYLDALNYRWMCGRAGQRDYHLLGNIYFYNISLSKIEKLVKSNVPQTHGQFFLTVSLILRLMAFASEAEDKADARGKVVSLLKNSLLSFEQPKNLMVSKLYFLFSVQFLLKERYVDREGNAVGVSELVTRLHCHEPSNFVFANFLVKGLFYKLCHPSHTGSKVFSKDVMEKLVLVLAHLFGRKYMPAAVVKSKQNFSKSKVFLEDLPEDFAAALAVYNHKIEENFGQFLQTFSWLANTTERYQLPISKLDFSSKEQPDSSLASHIMSCDQERIALSPFVCLSGNSDLDLLHAGTVNNVMLHALGIPAANIPILYLKKCDKQGRGMPLNAYVLDFYKHGSLAALSQDNGLHEGEAYRLLRDFAFTVKTISVSLRDVCGSEDWNVVRAFEQLSRSYWEKLERVSKQN
ncbi:probable ATP-dependent RNA helicase DDX60 isoform X2 [Hemicordylus capensis]|uniref:probable ATP-dependent RNA helicase DDX60 isoform X2 n=1 Tax=Hemicordylus capensis TaxID=884348 RepID=UPI002303E21E|nr:probable ATP-dependent RNA helicase DDX60 isoform X2 [Hemicordylus capensis]